MDRSKQLLAVVIITQYFIITYNILVELVSLTKVLIVVSTSDGLSVVGTLVTVNGNKLVILICQVLRYINILMGKLF